MEHWLDPAQEVTALAVSLCLLVPIYLRLTHPIPGLVIVSGSTLLVGSSVLPATVDLVLASSLLAATLVATRRGRLSSWLSVSGGSSELAVQVSAHPVSSKLQIFHLSRWFDAILIDPANPPLRVGETVYLIRHSGRQAWVSRVRSHTPPDDSHQRRGWDALPLRYSI